MAIKPFDQLTRLGVIQRLRRVALRALKAYDLEVKWVRFLTIETNTMFQVRTEDGERYVLRIYSEEETTLRENQAEMFWLGTLIRDTDIKVTEPVPRRDGEYITIVQAPGVPGEKRCALFKWVPGKQLENYLNPENYYKFGGTLAKLHNHAASLNPLPEEINPKRWDKVFYYPDEPVVYHLPEYGHLFPPERIEILEKVIALSDQVFERLFSQPEDMILIHGDLHFWNVHIYKGELYVIDFEDINLGYPIQDVAVTLYYGRDREGYAEWAEAFQRGYESVRPWPAGGEQTIETLMAARAVMFVNYVARIDPEPETFIDAKCEDLDKFLTNFG
jgi:Ser/Thr protein kinase RdoA (MazF antagonist)